MTIDARQLPPTRGARLCRLIDAARFFDVAPQSPPTGARDAQCYTIAIEDGERKRTVEVKEPIADARMRDLVDELVDCANSQRQSSRQGR